ncbi:MAG: 3-phosphoshikimate 1-carboxyvinyltransferase [Dehalococcoidales bacterium]|nr:3-phosphoshikimate 1-carboxyvinyltransferase [Dehalococcoidales bacterium]
MKASISKSEIAGKVTAPSSKSYTIRGLMCGALARGKSTLVSPLASDDTVAATNVLKKTGIGIRKQKNNWVIEGGHFHATKDDLFCGDSAATLRFMTAVCSIIPGTTRLTAGPSLSRRPVETLLEALRQLGVNCASSNELPPVTINGGKLKGGTTSLPGNISSQFVSALLQIAPFAENGIVINLTSPLESRPYVMMTLDAMQWFGITTSFNDNLDRFEISPQRYRPTKFRVEGDWSSASYLLALGTLAGEVEVNNLDTQSLQGDRMIVRFLQEMGASVITGRNSVIVRQSKLKAIKADLNDCIDLLPTMAVLASVAEGTSEFTGIERARIKESDRVTAVRAELEKMGVHVTEEPTLLTIKGTKPKGARIDSYNDHRIAMAFGLLGSVVGGIIIEQAECVAKTYPDFWEVFKKLGGNVKLDE